MSFLLTTTSALRQLMVLSRQRSWRLLITTASAPLRLLTQLPLETSLLAAPAPSSMASTTSTASRFQRILLASCSLQFFPTPLHSAPLPALSAILLLVRSLQRFAEKTLTPTLSRCSTLVQTLLVVLQKKSSTVITRCSAVAA